MWLPANSQPEAAKGGETVDEARGRCNTVGLVVIHPLLPNSFPKRQGITGLEENAMQFTKKVQERLLSPAPISFDYF